MKKILSVILVAAMLIGLVPAVFAAESTRNFNEWVFTRASHGKTSDVLAYDTTNKVSAFKMEDTVASVSDKWEFVNQVGGSGYSVMSGFFHFYGNTDAIPGFGSRAFVLEIQTDMNGKVSPSITVSKNTYGVIWEIYLIEKPANPEAWHCNTAIEGKTYGNLGNISALTTSIDTKYRLGVIDAYSAETKVVTEILPEITIKPGNYYLVGVVNGANPDWAKKHQMIDLVSFKLKNRALPEAVKYTYDITTNALEANAQGIYGKIISKNGSAADIIDNGDMVYVSWKQIYSTNYAAAIDTTKTTGYQLYGRNSVDSSLNFTEAGMASVLKLGNTAGSGMDSDSWQSTSYTAASATSRPIYAIRINVPETGKYNVSILNRYTLEDAEVKNALGWHYEANGAVKGTFDKGALTKVHLVNASDVQTLNGTNKNLPFPYSTSGTVTNASNLDALIANDKAKIGYYDSNKITTDRANPTVTTLDKTIDVAAGEYYIIFDIDADAFAKQPKAWGRNISGTYYYYQAFLLSGITLTPIDETDYSSINNEYNSIVNVDAGNGKEVATTIENAEVKAVASDINGVAIGSGAIIPSETVAVGSSYKADAPEIDGYKFLYWAKGIGRNRKIVSHNKSYSFKVASGGTLLMAVYAKNESANNVAMFYNGNGQLLATQTGTYNAPALPSMAGFGKATHWAVAGSGEEIAEGATSEISGEMSFVAQYGELKTVNVTVENGMGGGEVAYGSNVTVTATERKNGKGAELFNYWENENGEILSFGLSYTFKALKDTTIKAVYKEYKPTAQTIKKIVVTKDGKNVFAEFIGIGNVIERGILFGENASLGNYSAKVTMNTDADEFTVYNDLEDEPKAIGYAILAGGKVIYSK